MPSADHEASNQSLVINPQTQALIDSALDEAFSAEPQNMLAVVEELYQSLGKYQESEIYAPLKVALESCWYYARAMGGILSADVSFNDAVDLLDRAADGFEELGLAHLRDLSIGMSAYCQAVVDVREMNIKQAIDRFNAVEDYLENAGRFSQKFKPLIEHMKPEMLFASSLPAIQQLDFATARTLTEEAAKAANRVADSYYEDNDPEQKMYQGLASLYQAFFNLFRSYSDMQQFEYDRIIRDSDLANDARSAREKLGQVRTFSDPIRGAAYLADAIAPLQEVIIDISHVMKKVFSSALPSDLTPLHEMRHKLKKAGELAAKSGPQAIVLVRFCENIANQIKNLERLARPTKKDFGIYSGLISAGIFAVMLLVISWANSALGLGLEPATLITTCMILALIAGFGFGALKFKSLLLPGKNTG